MQKRFYVEIGTFFEEQSFFTGLALLLDLFPSFEKKTFAEDSG